MQHRMQASMQASMQHSMQYIMQRSMQIHNKSLTANYLQPSICGHIAAST